MKLFSVIVLMMFLKFAFCINLLHAQVTIPFVDSTTLYTYEWNLFKLSGVNLYNIDWSRLPSIQFIPGEPIKIKGQLGCNPFTGFAKMDKETMKLSIIPKTQYTCSKNDIDYQFLNILYQVDEFKIKNNELKFYGHGILLAKFSPDISNDNAYPIYNLSGEWRVEHFSGLNSLKDNFKNWQPTITFNINNPDSLAGFTGCRHFTSTLNIRNSKMSISNLQFLGDSLCNNNLESTLIKLLLEINAYMLGNDILYLQNGNSVTIMLHRTISILQTKSQATRFRDRKNRKHPGVCGN